MATTLDVDDIATDSHLSSLPGSASKLARAMPTLADRDAIRAAALQDVVNALQTRTPPVFEADLADITELRDAVVYRSLTVIFRTARSTAGDSFDLLARDYDREYQSAVRRSYTVSGSLSGPSGFTFSLERR
jgi:hypothetical protein